MTFKEMKNIIDRIDNLCDKVGSFKSFNADIESEEYFFKTYVLQNDFNKVDNILKEVEKVDNKRRREIEEQIKKREEESKELIRLKEQQELNKIRLMEAQAKRMLTDTLWSMVSDAPLSQEGKALYRDYRQYLRDIVQLWDNQQITEPRVMDFDEWRENRPSYKVVKKEII